MFGLIHTDISRALWLASRRDSEAWVTNLVLLTQTRADIKWEAVEQSMKSLEDHATVNGIKRFQEQSGRQRFLSLLHPTSTTCLIINLLSGFQIICRTSGYFQMLRSSEGLVHRPSFNFLRGFTLSSQQTHVLWKPILRWLLRSWIQCGNLQVNFRKISRQAGQEGEASVGPDRKGQWREMLRAVRSKYLVCMWKIFNKEMLFAKEKQNVISIRRK